MLFPMKTINCGSHNSRNFKNNALSNTIYTKMRTLNSAINSSLNDQTQTRQEK